MQITGEIVSLGVTVVGLVLTVWWRIETRMRAVEQRGAEETARQVAAFSEFQVTVAREYVSQDRLREVETRLVTAIERLSTTVERMPDRLAAIVKEAVGGR